MNMKYTPEFILSFETTVQQPRFEELETTVRECKEFIQLFEDNAQRCRKVLVKLPVTPEIQQILSSMTIIENRWKKWKGKKMAFSPEKKTERKIIKPSQTEMERLSKSMSLPAIKVNQSSQRTVEHQLLVKEFAGQFYQMTKHSSGTSLLIKLIETATDIEMEEIVDELDEHLEEIIVHQNGQHLIPKIMEKKIRSINDFIVDIVKNDLVNYCCSMFGGYTIQKMAPLLREEDIMKWKPLLKEHLCTLVLNQHGNYVIQTLLKSFGEKHADFFYDGLHDHVMRICTDKIGCSVMTNAINNATKAQLDMITPAILSHCSELIVDQFGNFVLQHLIDNNPPVIIPVIDTILTDLIYFCNHKFASNVVERCLLASNTQGMKTIKQKQVVLRNRLMDDTVLKELLDNQYGNFVIQAFIDSVPQWNQKQLEQLLRPHIKSHSQFSYFIERKLKTTQLM